MLAITTVHQDGFLKYGENCLESLSKHFPGKIVAYLEAEEAPIDRVEYRDFFSIPGVSAFLERISKISGADGKGPNGYDYRYDANKFCRKVFAQDACFDEDQYVFWFDADCVVQQPMSEKFLRGLLSGPFTYLGRNGEMAYTETGWLGFDTKAEGFEQFRSKYLDYFTSGRIFSQLKGWHDCIAFDYARQGIRGKNLTPSAWGVQQVVIDSVLAPYLVHLKGNRKFRGTSVGV
ncbi:MAG TPA: hypothetical protein VJ742_07260 [Nitrososphaera sp.]|nr:hypothetical protein [Nitrososphaera sp.]